MSNDMIEHYIQLTFEVLTTVLCLGIEEVDVGGGQGARQERTQLRPVLKHGSGQNHGLFSFKT